MKKRDTTLPDTKSGKEVAKDNGAKASKFTRDYWLPRVFKPRYRDKAGTQREVNEFWARIQHASERRAIGLVTNSRQEAARVAAAVFSAVRVKGWHAGLAEALPGYAERREAATSQTFGEALAAALAAKAADVKPVTLQGYASSARQLVALAMKKDDARLKYDYIGGGRAKYLGAIESLPVHKITTEALQAAIDAKIATARDDASRERSTRRTCAAAAREAKSLFSGRPWNPFAALAIRCPAPPQYNGRLDVGALLRAGMELRATDPQQLGALLLFAGAGLRKSEADAARWNWIDAESSTITVCADGNFTPKTHASEAPVFVDGGFVAALLSLRPADADDADFILAPEVPALPLATFTRYRAAKVFGRLAHWLREQGLTTRTPLHDLRREFGSYIAQTADIFTASRQLRHSSIQVTASFYAAQRRHVAPALASMLNPQPASQTAAQG